MRDPAPQRQVHFRKGTEEANMSTKASGDRSRCRSFRFWAMRYHRALSIGQMEGSKNILLKGRKSGVLRVFEVPSLLLFHHPPRSTVASSNQVARAKKKGFADGWVCRLMGSDSNVRPRLETLEKGTSSTLRFFKGRSWFGASFLGWLDGVQKSPD